MNLQLPRLNPKMAYVTAQTHSPTTPRSGIQNDSISTQENLEASSRTLLVRKIKAQLPRGFRNSYSNLSDDLFQGIEFIRNSARKKIHMRIGRCQFNKSEDGRCSIMIFDIHEAERTTPIRRTSKWIKPENFLVTCNIETNQVFDVTQWVSIAKNSPILDQSNSEIHLTCEDDYQIYYKINKHEASEHPIYIQRYKGKNLLDELILNKEIWSAQKREKIILAILEEAGHLFQFRGYKIHDVKLDNMTITEAGRKIKIHIIDHVSQADTFSKIPSAFLQKLIRECCPDTLGDEDFDDPNAPLKLCILLTVACVEILSKGRSLHVHEMTHKELRHCLENLDSILLKAKSKPICNPVFEIISNENYTQARTLIETADFFTFGYGKHRGRAKNYDASDQKQVSKPHLKN